MGDTAILRPLQITIAEDRYVQLLQIERTQKEYVTKIRQLEQTNLPDTYTEISQLKLQLAALQTEVIRLSTENASLSEKIECLQQPIYGRIVAKVVENYILAQLLPTKCIPGSLKDVVKFLDDVDDNKLGKKQLKKWNNIPQPVRTQIMDYYHDHDDELDVMSDSIIAVKDVGNEIAHPKKIVSKNELIAFYTVATPENLPHLNAIYSYLETNNIPLPFQPIY
jgi:hypothetical protein